ncbi:MAG: bifunctional molybdenum cofactor biosynthesis protein MoaC/MoaB [Bdellovibrionia bacterium]
MESIKPSPPLGDKASTQSFQMIDIGAKTATARRAIAQGEIFLSHDAFFAIQHRKNPKGDVLALAEIAGIMAAKRTSEIIPLCHPLALDRIVIEFRLDPGNLSVMVFCEVSTHGKTGVEMEALSGVHGALLSIYDLSKAVNPVLTISNIRLNIKEGGKSGKWTHPDFIPPQSVSELPLKNIRASIITISDRASAGKSQDTSGPVIQDFLNLQGCTVSPILLIPDEKKEIQSAVLRAIHEDIAHLVITTGGTGLSPRDVTPEAIEEISDRIIPGFGECLRTHGSHQIQSAWLSRSIGALIGKSLVIALPGSQKAVREGLQAIQGLLPHALHTAQGGGHD